MCVGILIAFYLVIFHGPDNQLIEVNPDEVVSIREPRDVEQHFHAKVNCLIFTSDGKFLGVVEDCHTVHSLLSEKHE
jgi:uncharacterized protein YrrD